MEEDVLDDVEGEYSPPIQRQSVYTSHQHLPINNIKDFCETIQKYEQYDDCQECFDLLSKTEYLKFINRKDDKHGYPLHCASNFESPKIMSYLLANKASLANRNQNGELAINNVHFDVLKEHFDSCIGINENLEITFNYETILPTCEDIGSKSDEEIVLISEDLKIEGTKMMNEVDAILYISTSTELKHLLRHPLLTSFLYMKWFQSRWIFFLNTLFYIIFCLSLFMQEIVSDGIFKYISKSLLILTTLFLAFRELFQLYFTGIRYFKNFENYLEMVIVLGVITNFFLSNLISYELKLQLHAVILLLSALELLLLLGKHPWWSKEINMFRTVSKNFIKIFSLYLILIFAFAFCFYLLFQNTRIVSKSSEGDKTTSVTLKSTLSSLPPLSNDTDNEIFQKSSLETPSSSPSPVENPIFINPSMAFLKTILMMTGEFEFGDLQVQNHLIGTYIIFTSFVLLVTIILFNLLNGLAISDTQNVVNKAEIIEYTARVEYIAYTESLFLGNGIFKKICNSFPISFIFKFLISYKKCKNFESLVCLGDFLENKKLTVALDGLVKNKCIRNETYWMEKDIVREAKALNLKRRMKRRRNKEREKNEKTYRMLEELKSKIDQISSKRCNCKL